MKKLKLIKTLKVLLLIVVAFVPRMGYSQFTIPEKPSFQTSVYDYAKLLSDDEKSKLEEKLIKYSDSTSTQIVVITEETINGEDIGILAPKWAQQWGIGQAKQDNGILILVAKQERKIWIAPGYGVEDKLTAGITGELTRNIIIPEFKAGSYYNGLDKGADEIIKVLLGKYKGTRKHSQNGAPIGAILFIIILILFFVLRNKNGRGGNGFGGGGGDLLTAIIFSNLGRGGFGGGSGGGFSGGGGGGFGGGFGGGGFSGGGAGGSW